jgi:repressor of nif and glnA expression
VSGGNELPPFGEEANFRPRGERPHPALLTLILASRNPRLLLSARGLRERYNELGLEVGERQIRNHRLWLLKHEYIIIYRTGWGPHVELTEKGLRFLRSLGLLKGGGP